MYMSIYIYIYIYMACSWLPSRVPCASAPGAIPKSFAPSPRNLHFGLIGMSKPEVRPRPIAAMSPKRVNKRPACGPSILRRGRFHADAPRPSAELPSSAELSGDDGDVRSLSARGARRATAGSTTSTSSAARTAAALARGMAARPTGRSLGPGGPPPPTPIRADESETAAGTGGTNHAGGAPLLRPSIRPHPPSDDASPRPLGPPPPAPAAVALDRSFILPSGSRILVLVSGTRHGWHVTTQPIHVGATGPPHLLESSTELEPPSDSTTAPTEHVVLVPGSPGTPPVLEDRSEDGA